MKYILKHNSCDMKHLLAALLCVITVTFVASAQQATPPPSSDTSSAAQTPDRTPIEAALKAYVSAYERRNMDELLVVWPDLQNQKKDYKKIKDHFDDGRISGVKMTLGPEEIQTSKDDAIARCERTEEYVKTVTHTEGAGDSMMSNPAQRPPPTQRISTSNEKKTTTVWFKLHKNGDGWQIVSVSDKQLSF
jgi:hypothetical protein